MHNKTSIAATHSCSQGCAVNFTFETKPILEHFYDNETEVRYNSVAIHRLFRMLVKTGKIKDYLYSYRVQSTPTNHPLLAKPPWHSAQCESEYLAILHD